jgi:hypothetical protein
MSAIGALRAHRRAILFWLGIAFFVWNGFFDILITRGEKFYLLSQARHELGLGPRLTIDEVMSRTIADAARVASIWAGIVFAAGIGTIGLLTGFRQARRPET